GLHAARRSPRGGDARSLKFLPAIPTRRRRTYTLDLSIRREESLPPAGDLTVEHAWIRIVTLDLDNEALGLRRGRYQLARGDSEVVDREPLGRQDHVELHELRVSVTEHALVHLHVDSRVVRHGLTGGPALDRRETLPEIAEQVRWRVCSLTWMAGIAGPALALGLEKAPHLAGRRGDHEPAPR